MNSHEKLVAQARLLRDIGLSLDVQHDWMQVQLEISLKRQFICTGSSWTIETVETLAKMPSVIAWWQQHWANADSAFLEWLEDYPRIMDRSHQLLNEYLSWHKRAHKNARVHSAVLNSYRTYVARWNELLMSCHIDKISV